MRDVVLGFIDTETGGFDETKHALLEVAVVKTTAALEVLDEWSWLVRALPGRTVQPEAFALHGLDGSHGADPAEVYSELAKLLAGSVAAGHNVSFDLKFLRQLAIDVNGGELPFGDHHQLDTASLVMPLWLSGEIESCSLGVVARALGIEQPRAHRALDDCRTTVEIYRRLRERMTGPSVRVERCRCGHAKSEHASMDRDGQVRPSSVLVCVVGECECVDFVDERVGR